MAARKSPTNIVSRFNQPIFFLALLGMLVVIHLHLQNGIDFARGPLGFGPPTMECSDCNNIMNSDYANFLGISNIFLGFLFYLIIAGLRFGITLIQPQDRPKWQSASLLVSSVGMLYAIWLVFVQVILLDGTFCTLCMISAAVVTILFVLHLLERGKTNDTKPVRRNYIVGLVILVALAAFDFSRVQGDGAPLAINSADSRQCIYDPDLTDLRVFDTFTADNLPFYGNPDSDVKIIKFFDPNCPHCASLHLALEDILPNIADDVRMYYQPTDVFRGQSIPQIQALYFAREAGIEPYMEMIDLQLRGQRSGAIPLDTLVAFAEQIGLNGEALRNDFATGRFVNLIRSDGGMASASGIRSVPQLVINGRGIANVYGNWTQECFEEFIQNAGG